MSLNIGFDSWVSLEEAEELIKSLFTSSNEYFLKWNSLSDEDKEILLRNSAFSISDSYRFTGRKQKQSQRLAFPRVLSALPVGVAYAPYISQLYDNQLVSSYSLDTGIEDAKRAQVVNSVYGSVLVDLSTESHKNFSSGLKSKSIGPISESYEISNNSYLESSLVGIYTKQVETILSSWLTSSHFSY